MSAPRKDDDDMLPITRLVRHHVDASGLTLRAFAEQRNGATRATLQRYYSSTLKPLTQGMKPQTVRDLANTLDVPLSVVQEAADHSRARLYDQTATVQGATRALMASMDQLTVDERKKYAKEIEKLLRDRASGGES